MTPHRGKKVEKLQLTAYVHPEIHRLMKTAAAQGSTTITSIIEGLCRQFLEANGFVSVELDDYLKLRASGRVK